MSADRWTVCPWCRHRHEKALKQAEENLQRSYGVINADAYRLAGEALARMRDVPVEETLPEYCEIGIGVGAASALPRFQVDYGATCRTEGCGFTFNFTLIREIPDVPTSESLGEVRSRSPRR